MFRFTFLTHSGYREWRGSEKLEVRKDPNSNPYVVLCSGCSITANPDFLQIPQHLHLLWGKGH